LGQQQLQDVRDGMMSWATHLKMFRLDYANRKAYIERLAEQSRREVADMLSRCQNPYLAFSGGKDSVLMLHLVRQVTGGTAVPAIWEDEWETRHTHDILDYIEREWGTRLIRVRSATDPEFFRRYGVHSVLNQAVRIDHTVPSWLDYRTISDFDGFFVGMRKDESTKRMYALQKATRHLKTFEMVRCAPIADWTYRDVWAYTAHHNLPINGRYPRLIEIGVDLKHARVGGLTTIRVEGYGAMNIDAEAFPDEYNAMLEANPIMRG
jgi:phosphoadenosine phosphosulfate reductase